MLMKKKNGINEILCFCSMEETVAQPNAEDLQKVKEILLKQAAVSEKSNGYWLGALSTYIFVHT